MDKNNIGINDALLKYANGLVIFDADPIDHFDSLEENKYSKFKLISKEIDHSFIEYYKGVINS